MALKRNLRQAVGNAPQILALVREAERSHGADEKALGALYETAMRAFGPKPLEVAREEYGELCVKRLLVLRRYDRAEARTFLRFLSHYGIKQQDERVRAVQSELDPKPAQPPVLCPQAQETPQAQKQGEEGRPSIGTPIRPRALRYSGCGTAELPEPPMRLFPLAEGGGTEPEAQACQGPAPARPGSAELDGASTMDWTRALENLSPIPEDPVEVDLHASESYGTPLSLLRTAQAEQKGPKARSGPPQPPGAAEGREPGPPEVAAPPVDGGELSDFSASLHEVGGTVDIPVVKPPKTLVVNGVSYQRLETIGRGGSSKVYHVVSPTGQSLALKRVIAGCDAHFKALANEVILLQQLKGTPNIIQVLDAELLPEKHLIHIVMERGDMDLGRLLVSEPELTFGDLQALWRQMLEAVQVVHSERIVHADLKPGNFLLVERRLKLIDFGIAKRIASNTTNISRETSVGTISYMAPEAVKQGSLKIGRPSDIWSLGIILYQMVYRRSPFAHLEPMQRLFALTDDKHVVEFPANHRLAGHSATTKEWLMDVLERCLQRDPRKRPTIPQLLEHPFLSSDSARVSRSSMDKALLAVVNAFFGAAKAALQEEGPGAFSPAEDELEEGGKRQDCLQALSDEVWMQLAYRSGQNKRPREATPPPQISEGVAPFKECIHRWVERALKRRRTEKAPQATAPPVVPAPSVVPAVQAPPAAPTACPLGPTSAWSQSGPSQLPLPPPPLSAGLFQPSARPPLPKPPAPAERAVGGLSSIHAELLQKQKASLRRVGADKENVAVKEPNKCPEKGPENVVLKRLKDRRALVALEPVDDETQLTKWMAGPS